MPGMSRSTLVAVLALTGCLSGAGCQGPALRRMAPGNDLGGGLSGVPAGPALSTRERPTPTVFGHTPYAETPQVAALGAPRLSEPVDRHVVWRASSRGYEPGEKGAIQPVVLQLPHKVPLGPEPNDLPKELSKTTMPPYRIEPPDILLIDTFRIIPKPPYRIEPLDELFVRADPEDVPLKAPIAGVFPVDNQGRIDLLFDYGKFQVGGLTVEEAAAQIRKDVSSRTGIKEPRLTVSLARTRGFQQVRGEHLVRMDGMVSLGVYGEVYVAGMTLEEARAAIKAQLSLKLRDPEVTVDVGAYNSKVYYVIFDGGGYGQQIVRLPVVGGETVLDALAQVQGIPPGNSDKKIWVARPVPGCAGYRQIMPVDWEAITEGAATTTNYQLFPGDRIYVKADCWIAFNNRINKIVSPFERIFGFMLIGNSAVRAVGGQNGGGGGTGGGGF